MASVYDILGWEDADGERHVGQPSDLQNTFGEFLHVYDDETGEEHYFWAFTPFALGSWEDWDAYIHHLTDQHGIELA